MCECVCTCVAIYVDECLSEQCVSVCEIRCVCVCMLMSVWVGSTCGTESLNILCRGHCW